MIKETSNVVRVSITNDLYEMWLVFHVVEWEAGYYLSGGRAAA